MRLENKSAVITGAAQGIGKAIAVQMAKEGASVLIADVDTGRGQKTTDEINEAGGKALFSSCDVADQSQLDDAVDKAIEHFGKLDIMVNNAGIINRDPVLEISADDWARVFAVNVNGTYHGTLAAGRHMVERGEGGHIINWPHQTACLGCITVPVTRRPRAPSWPTPAAAPPNSGNTAFRSMRLHRDLPTLKSTARFSHRTCCRHCSSAYP